MKQIGILFFLAAIFFTNPMSAKAETITVDPYRDNYVIMAGTEYDEATGRLYYIPINPDGTFGAVSFVADLGYRAGAGIADFDNDGDLDFVAGARDDFSPIAHFYLFKNLGSGKFMKTWIASVDSGLPVNKVGTFAVADFNGDGLKDFVAPIYGSNHVHLFTNNGDKTFTVSELPISTLQDPLDAREGDFNQDGRMDFVITDYSSAKVYLYEGDGNGDFTVRELFTVAGGHRAADITVGDFNGDGLLDIIVDDFIPYGGGGHLYLADSEGNFQHSVVYSRPLLGTYYTYGVDSFDFDRDGNRDLILSTYEYGSTGVVFVMKGNGDGTFQEAEQIPTPPFDSLGSVFPVTPSLARTVAIDIKPGDNTNIINLRGMKTVSVAILSSVGFDAPSKVDPTTLTFGGTGEEQSPLNCSSRRPKDVNGDGRKDLVCEFSTKGFQYCDTVGVLTGETLTGEYFEGSQAVMVMPCK